MRIAALTLHGERGWPDLVLNPVSPGLHCYYGPQGSGKTTAAAFLAHVLYGKQPSCGSLSSGANVLEGEVQIESGKEHYRLRRYHDGTMAGRLTVASLDASPVDRSTVHQLLGGLSPTVLSRLFAISFDAPPPVSSLLAEEVAREFQSFDGGEPENGRRLAELARQRDTLAEELETRIAAERRVSHELDEQSRELDRTIHSVQQEVATLEQRLRAMEAALAETDSRLRYRRLELNTELRWNAVEAEDLEPQLAELDEQIARWRATLGDLANREASVRARLAQVKPSGLGNGSTVTDQRAWLAVARQLAADLDGEVARLARATSSDRCVCRDSHPRLRPIVESMQRQLQVLESLVDQQELALRSTEFEEEAGHLARSQAELRRQLEHLLDRRHAVGQNARPSRWFRAVDPVNDHTEDSSARFSAADAEQLEQRRLELEQERFALVERLRASERQLRELRSRRTEVDRERASILSASSIAHVQRELADVQQQLALFASGTAEYGGLATFSESPLRASDYLAQLTDGRLVRLQLVGHGRSVSVVNRDGATVPLESLTAGEHDLVYLSLSLAMASAASRQGVNLPLVIDDPFVRLDTQAITALAAVLEHFSRQGHQIVVFTSRHDAAERLTALGCRVENLLNLRQRNRQESDSTAINRAEVVKAAKATDQPIAIVHSRHPDRAAQQKRGPRPRRFHLELACNVSDAPSIGPKTAQRLANAGIQTVADLLAADPVEAARRLGSRHIQADTIRTWQRQAKLVCQIPQLRPHDAQILVGCGLTSAEQIAQSQPEELVKLVSRFCDSKEGGKLLRADKRPELAQVAQWITRAGRRRKLNAA